MKCGKCGEEYEDEFDFCPHCGTQTHKGGTRCPFCAEWIETDAIECRYCDSDLNPPTSETPKSEQSEPSLSSKERKNKRPRLTPPELEKAKSRYMSLIGLQVAWVIGGGLVLGFILRSPNLESIIVGTVGWVLLLYTVVWYGLKINERSWQMVLAVPLHLLLWVPGVLYELRLTKGYDVLVQVANSNREEGS